MTHGQSCLLTSEPVAHDMEPDLTMKALADGQGRRMTDMVALNDLLTDNTVLMVGTRQRNIVEVPVVGHQNA